MSISNITKQFEKLNYDLYEFVKKSTVHFDDSHNHVHALRVVENSFAIMTMDLEIKDKIEQHPEITRLVMIVGWLHDVRDHKYPESISEDELNEFIWTIEQNFNSIKMINKVIAGVSWSKEAKGLREELPEPYNTILQIVADADRLEALGKVGIERCEIFTRERGGSVPKDVIAHCYDKLLRILPEGFIKTEYGRFLAQPLHQEIVNYVNKYESVKFI